MRYARYQHHVFLEPPHCPSGPKDTGTSYKKLTPSSSTFDHEGKSQNVLLFANKPYRIANDLTASYANFVTKLPVTAIAWATNREA